MGLRGCLKVEEKGGEGEGEGETLKEERRVLGGGSEEDWLKEGDRGEIMVREERLVWAVAELERVDRGV